MHACLQWRCSIGLLPASPFASCCLCPMDSTSHKPQHSARCEGTGDACALEMRFAGSQSALTLYTYTSIGNATSMFMERHDAYTDEPDPRKAPKRPKYTKTNPSPWSDPQAPYRYLVWTFGLHVVADAPSPDCTVVSAYTSHPRTTSLRPLPSPHTLFGFLLG